MKFQDEITVYLPSEHFDALSEVMEVGLQKARIDHVTRKALVAWWDVEKSFIEDEINND